MVLSNFRLQILAFLIFFVAGSLIVKLYSLQVISHNAYQALASEQHSVFQKLVPKRGEIFLRDRDKIYPVAVNREIKMIYAVPKEIDNSDKVAGELARILGVDEGELKDKLSRREDMYEVIKHKLSEEEVKKIEEFKFKGIYLADETFRYYPAGELASHVLGFVGWKDEQFGGRYGVELFFEDSLKGHSGRLFHDKDNSGRWVPLDGKEIDYARDGDDLVLTIDHIIQYESERILKGSVEKFRADRGTVIVMEVSTGKILALANYPAFDPSNYAQEDNLEVFRNIAVSDAYECGSVFKTITIAAAIDGGKINPDTTYIDTGQVTEAGYSIRNSDEKAYGRQTMTQVLEKSLNTGVIFAEKLLGNRNFSDYVKRFGFGEISGIDIFGEASGNIKNLDNLRSDIQFFTASFGQGITVTPIQLISAYNAIANGGVLMKPQLVERVVRSDETEETIEPKEVRRVISHQAAYKTAKILESVVKNGHGKRAGVPGFLVGGKTGTAQVASSSSRGYEEGKNIGSFVGFAPIDVPRFTILVRIDNPKEVEWAESSAAPVFGELMKFLLEYERVEPTQAYTQKELDEFNVTHILRNFVREKEEEERKKEKEEEHKQNED